MSVEHLITNPLSSHRSFGQMPVVTNSFDSRRNCPGGEIVLPLGDISRGLIHIQKQAGRIMQSHGVQPIDHLATVCGNFHEIYSQTRTGTFLLLKYNGVKAAVVAAHVDTLFQIITTFPIDRPINHNKRQEFLIWRR